MVIKLKVEDNKRIRHVPYHARRTLTANAPVKEELIKDDSSIGLGTVGRSGYIINEGPGVIELRLYDGRDWTDWIAIKAGTGIDINYEDNIWIEKLKIKTDKTRKVTYDITINPGLEED